MDITKDIDGKPLTRAFSFTREKEQALHALMGILFGLIADKQLNKKEFLFMDAWLKSQQSLAGDKDALNMLARVGEILEDGQISAADLEQMQSSIEVILATKEHESPDIDNQLEELIGFLTGVASDGVLNDQEIEALSLWLENNSAVVDRWPASVIADRVSQVLEDGIISDEEREDLLATVNKITRVSLGDTSAYSEQTSTEFWEDEIDSLTLAGATFCLTGDFVSGDRNAVEFMLKCRGANTKTNVNNNIDYLVIGTLARRDWLYSSHGRKIEKALLLKREGIAITIITERTLLKFTRHSGLL